MIEPGRLVRAWTWHLPGAAMLTVDRFAAACGTSGRIAAGGVEGRTDGGGEGRGGEDRAGEGAELVVLTEGVRQRGREVRRRLEVARGALVAGDRVGAAKEIVAAREIGAALVDPVIDAWTDMFASMIAVADGATELGAVISVRAEGGAVRGADAASFLAVWWTRAVRALRRGHAADGIAIARWMRSWIEGAAPALAGWLRCFEAAHHLDDNETELAIATCAPVLAEAPATAAGWAAGRLVTRAFLTLARAEDAARIAVATLDHASGAPDAVRAQCYAGAAAAFEAAELGDAARRCAEIALGLDPRVEADPSRAEVDGAGVELILL